MMLKNLFYQLEANSISVAHAKSRPRMLVASKAAFLGNYSNFWSGGK